MQERISVRTVPIRFAAGPDWSGPPTLGQRNVLAWIERQRVERSDVIWNVVPAPAGAGLEAIVEAARTLLLRHEGLRTTYTRTPDGEPVQHVAGSGEFGVAVLDEVEDAALPTVVELDETWKRPFDLAAEFGFRVGVYTRAGQPILVLLVVSHMAADFATVQILTRELLELLGRPGHDGAKALHQPREEAAREQSPAGRRRAEANLRYWESIMRKSPQCMFALPPDPAGLPGQRQGVLRSRAAALAIGAVVARTGASRSTVVFAAGAALLSHLTGNDSCVLVSLSSNRFAQGTRDYVGTIAQDSLAHLEIGATFDEVVHAAGTATMRAYAHARYDAARLYEVMGAVEYGRGTRFHRDCVFSDLSVHRDSADPAPDDPTPGGGPPADGARAAPDISALMAESEFTFVPELNRQALFQFELYGSDSHTTLMLLADTRFLPPAAIEGFLRGVERLLVAAAGRVVAIAELGEVTGVRAAVRGEGWIRVEGCWVQPEAVQRLMDDLDLVKCARVFVEDEGGAPSLTARLVPADPDTAPADVHLAAVARLRERFTAIAPQRYALYADTPEDPEDPGAWRRLEPLAEGSGRLAEPPVGRPEEIWCPPR